MTPSPIDQSTMLNALLDKRRSEGELDEYERGVVDTLSWILDGASKPEIELS